MMNLADAYRCALLKQQVNKITKWRAWHSDGVFVSVHDEDIAYRALLDIYRVGIGC